MPTLAVRIITLTRALAQERHPGGRTCRQVLATAAGCGLLALAGTLLALARRDHRHTRYLAEAGAGIHTPEELVELARRSCRGDLRQVVAELRAKGIIRS